MKFENVSFNEKFVKKFTTAQFAKHKSNAHLWPKITKEQREERLKEVHKLIKMK